MARVVPSVSGTHRAQDRLTHLRLLSTLPAPYYVPKFVDVSAPVTDAQAFLVKHSLSLPLVCKPAALWSHEVYLLPDLPSLLALKPPCIVQEFVAHDAVLFKVYVMGQTDITVCRRRSVRNDVSLEEVHFGRISKQPYTLHLEQRGAPLTLHEDSRAVVRTHAPSVASSLLTAAGVY